MTEAINTQNRTVSINISLQNKPTARIFPEKPQTLKSLKEAPATKKLANAQSRLAQKVINEKADGYISEVLESWGEDWDELAADAKNTHSFIGKQSLKSSALQQVGNLVDFGVDAIGSLIVNDKTKELSKQAIDKITKTEAYQTASKELAEITGETLQTVNAYLDKNPEVKKVLLQSAHASKEMAQEVINKVKEVAAEHPEAVRNLGAAGEIIQVVPVGKALSLGVKGGKAGLNTSVNILKRVEIKVKPGTLGMNGGNIDFSIKPKKTIKNKVLEVKTVLNNKLPRNFEFAGKNYSLDIDKNPVLKQRLEALSPRLKRIREEKLKNLAEKYPDGVNFTKKGFADFNPYVHKHNGKLTEVDIKRLNPDPLSKKGAMGSQLDMKDANNKMKAIDPNWKQPDNYTWHHIENTTKLHLVPTDLHSAVGHSGGRYTHKF